MRLAVIGSRRYPLTERVREYVFSLPADTVVVTGGWPVLSGAYDVVEATAGVDREAYLAAEQHGLVTVLVSGSKTVHKHRAGLQRNPITVALAEAVVAFWDLQSSGTANTLALALDAKKPTMCVGPDGYQVPHFAQLLPRR